MRIKSNTKVVAKKSSKKQLVNIDGALVENKVILKAHGTVKRGQVYLDYLIHHEYRTDDKKRVRPSTGLKATDENVAYVKAHAMELALKHYLQHNEVLDDNVKFEDIALKAIEEDASERSADVQGDYINIYNNYILPFFKGMALKDIRSADLKRWKKELLASKELSRSRYLKYHRTLNFIFKYAFMNEYLEKNLVDLLDKKSKAFVEPKTNGMHKYYSKDEVKRIIDAAKGWFKQYLIVLFYTGMRTGESLALQWSDLDFTAKKITLQRSIRHGVIRDSTKTGTTSKIDMPLPVEEALLHLKKMNMNAKWVFPHPTTHKHFYEPKPVIRQYFKPLLEKLGITYRTLYATRHSFASVMVETGVPLTYVQKQLTHKKLSTTMDFYVKNSQFNNNERDSRVDTMFS